MDIETASLTLARQAVETFCRQNTVIDPPDNLPERLLEEQQGVFVTLKKEGELRGCTGTFLPTQENIALEIIRNAVGSASRDPRFPPVEESELSVLTYTVSLLSRPEPVEDPGNLDPAKYGVIAEKGRSRGLLLPDLEGIDTIEQQLSMVNRKAGLPPDASGVEYEKFTVEKFTEE